MVSGLSNINLQRQGFRGLGFGFRFIFAFNRLVEVLLLQNGSDLGLVAGRPLFPHPFRNLQIPSAGLGFAHSVDAGLGGPQEPLLRMPVHVFIRARMMILCTALSIYNFEM